MFARMGAVPTRSASNFCQQLTPCCARFLPCTTGEGRSYLVAGGGAAPAAGIGCPGAWPRNPRPASQTAGYQATARHHHQSLFDRASDNFRFHPNEGLTITSTSDSYCPETIFLSALGTLLHAASMLPRVLITDLAGAAILFPLEWAECPMATEVKRELLDKEIRLLARLYSESWVRIITRLVQIYLFRLQGARWGDAVPDSDYGPSR